MQYLCQAWWGAATLLPKGSRRRLGAQRVVDTSSLLKEPNQWNQFTEKICSKDSLIESVSAWRQARQREVVYRTALKTELWNRSVV